jgi:hypothetical protein
MKDVELTWLLDEELLILQIMSQIVKSLVNHNLIDSNLNDDKQDETVEFLWEKELGACLCAFCGWIGWVVVVVVIDGWCC